MAGPVDRRTFVGGALAGAGALAVAAPAGATQGGWVKLPTEPYRGKQDDVAFVSRDVGWYGNGQGKLFKTVDGGASWTKILDRPGTFVRALGFVDEKTGFLGNVGTDYFPGVTDTTPLYRTEDGGLTWSPVTEIDGPAMKGICAIDVRGGPFVNHGDLGWKGVVRAAGRVGGPAFLAESRDGGRRWRSRDMNGLTAAIFDVLFVTDRVGFIAGATAASPDASSGLILRTDDGGETWREVYRGSRPWELTWKIAFPTPETGYVTLQSYNPDPTASQRFVLKTTDGGRSWRELPVVDDHAWRPFGVGFVNARWGWIGGSTGGLETEDGGETWRKVEMGRAVNKIRVVRGGPVRVFAIGAELHRLDVVPLVIPLRPR